MSCARTMVVVVAALGLAASGCGKEDVELVDVPEQADAAVPIEPGECEVCDALGGCGPAPDGAACASGSCFGGVCTPTGDCDSGERFVAAAAGEHHTCGLGFAGDLYCWGENDQGQLGLGDLVAVNEPTPVGMDRDWELIAAGWKHSCGQRRDGSAWCWGRNGDGELGIGNQDTPQPTPQSIAGDAGPWQQLVAGEHHTCGRDSAGALWCWGEDRDGELGLGAPMLRTAPEELLTPDVDWREVAASGRHTCAVDWNSRLWCWGNNQEGQLGTGDLDPRTTPTEITGPVAWKSVAAGGRHTCALDSSGALYCWGRDKDGETGTTGGDRVLVPEPVAPQLHWSRVALGDRHTCGIAVDGSLWCWGRNDFGQLGLGDADNRDEPVRVGTASDWSLVTGGQRHTCALRANGALFCFGLNEDGQLGVGDIDNRDMPTQLCPARAVD